MSINGFTSKIELAQASETVLSFVRDYATPSSNPFIPLQNIPLVKPFLSVPNAAALGLVGVYVIDTLDLTSSQISQQFVCARSMSFNFRPLYFATGKGNSDYNANLNQNRYATIPTVVLYNQRTGQTVYIRPNKLVLDSVTVAGTTTSYAPMSLTVQGSVPFYFTLNDTVTVGYINPNYGSSVIGGHRTALSVQYGKLELNFFNFDQSAWTDTNFDQMIECA